MSTERIVGQLFEYHVKGTAYRKNRSNSSSTNLEKKVVAYGKAAVFNNPSDFGFLKVHTVTEVR